MKGGDCDDGDGGTNPLAEEECYNDIDDNCGSVALPAYGAAVCGPDGCGSACGSCPMVGHCVAGQCNAGVVPASFTHRRAARWQT